MKSITRSGVLFITVLLTICFILSACGGEAKAPSFSDIEGYWTEIDLQTQVHFDNSGGWVWLDGAGDVQCEGTLEAKDGGYVFNEVSWGELGVATFDTSLSSFKLESPDIPTYEFERGGVQAYEDAYTETEPEISDDAQSGDDAESDVPEVSADAPLILTNDEIYYHAASGGVTLQFFDDGRLQMNSYSEIIVYEYEFLDDYTISVTLDGEFITEMDIIDPCTLEDDAAEVYTLPDTEGQELVVDSIYYFNAGDSGAYFWDGGVVEAMNEDGDTVSGTYTVEDNFVFLEYDGEVTDRFTIVNRRVLRHDSGDLLIRLY